MHLALFLAMVAISLVAVRIGAVLFELTGLERSVAMFQAISCFTSTGFTTRESEMIAASAQRRRIASWLMVLGNAGFITLIAAFVNGMKSPELLETAMPFLRGAIPPSLAPVCNLLFIATLGVAAYGLVVRTGFSARMVERVRQRLIERGTIQRVKLEQIVATGGGVAVARIEVGPDCPLAGQAIEGGRFKERDIAVLAIERDGATLMHPAPAETLRAGDRLLCFGRAAALEAGLD